MRGLIVDDNADYAEMLKLALNSHFELDLAENGTEGVKAFCRALKEDRPYQLIVLDLQMPMRDGLETVRTIRSIETRLMMSGALGTKILIVTGFPGKAMAAKTLLMGCEAVIAKTDGTHVILAKLRELGLLEDDGGTAQSIV